MIHTLRPRGPAAAAGAPARRRSPVWPWRSLLMLALLLFALAGTYQLQLPGLNYDEALDVVPAMNSVLGQPLDAEASVRFAGIDWPLMIMPYLGPTTSLLLIPAFFLAGVSVATLRLTTLAVGALTLLLAWGFLRDLFDERVAGIVVLLLAIDPSYVFMARMGALVGQPMLPLAIAAVWCLYRWYSRGRQGYLILAGLLLGFGVTTKLLFFWVWAALAAAWLLLTPWLVRTGGWRRWLWPFRRTNPAGLALTTAATLLGAGIAIWYNLRSGGAFRFFTSTVAAGTSLSGTGFESLANIPGVALHDFTTLLNGSWFGYRYGGLHSDPLALPALAAALLALAALLIRSPLRYSPRRVALLALLMVCFVIEAAATRMSQGATHLILVWPYPQALIAAALVGSADALAARFPARSRLWPYIVGIGLVCIGGAEAWTTYGYHQSLARTGGTGFYSDAIYSLAHDLDQPGVPAPVALDWGFRRNLQILTQNRVDPPERYTFSSPPGEDFRALVEDIMQHPTGLYLFHAPPTTAFPGHWEQFERAAYRYRLTPTLWKAYSQRDGEPVYLVYRLDPAARLDTLPAEAHPLSVRAGDSIGLLGYQVTAPAVHAGDTLQVTLYWRADAAQQRHYKVFAHLLDTSGQPWAEHDGEPGDWGYPTTRWQPGEIVADRLWLPIKADAPTGTYRVFVGLYDAGTGQRLPLVRDGERLQGDTLELLELGLTPR